MRSTSFPFTERQAAALGTVQRPMADVLLRDKDGNPITVAMLVDSGADVSVLSPQIARILGLKIKGGERRIFRGIGGTMVAYLHQIPITIGDLTMTLPVAIPLREVTNLLGRMGILDTCSIHLLREKVVTFEYD